jgi:phosphoadenosine phosphosulfate reductase
MSGIEFRAIYRNTTIDPPGTIAHVKANGVEILRPKQTFFQLIEQNGFPNRFMRFCCRYLKEYKVLDRCIMGVRKAESTKRAARYNEPTECRFYGSKRDHVEAFYPILDWSDQDIVDFITERGIKLHPLYYREDGSIDPKRRLGCMCCPLAYYKKRIEQFKEHPNMVKAYIRAGQKFRDTHPDAKSIKTHPTIYQQFVRDVFFERQRKFEDFEYHNMFGQTDYKQFLMDYFGIDL